MDMTRTWGNATVHTCTRVALRVPLWACHGYGWGSQSVLLVLICRAEFRLTLLPIIVCLSCYLPYSCKRIRRRTPLSCKHECASQLSFGFALLLLQWPCFNDGDEYKSASTAKLYAGRTSCIVFSLSLLRRPAPRVRFFIRIG